MCRRCGDYQQSVDFEVLEEAESCLGVGTPTPILGQAGSSKRETPFARKGMPVFKGSHLAATLERQVKTTVKTHEHGVDELRTLRFVISGASAVVARWESGKRRWNGVR